ncbi:MAG: hypothetical protein KA981_00065 [Bacteroidia bacterium]|nr:hypothetical protein [Bacteroidia bacterium]
MNLTLPKQKVLIALAIVSLVLVCMPRFNGNQTFVKQEPWDAKYFNSYVNYFRGESHSAPIRPASNWRFLVPLLASALPFDAPTSLNVLNILFLLGALFFLHQSLYQLKINREKIWLAIALFIFSFPCFYYGTISYVDPGSVFFVSAGLYAWIRQKYWAFILTILIGLMAKETVAVLFPLALVSTLIERKYILFFALILFLLIFLLEYQLIKTYAPLSDGEIRFSNWKISTTAFWNNINRPHSWLAFVFSFGIPGFGLIQSIATHKMKLLENPLLAGCLAGVASCIALYLFSFITTVADGRIIWHAYFYMFVVIFAPIKKQAQASNNLHDRI